MEYIFDRITIDDSTLNGKPSIREKRISVQTILEFLGAGESNEEIPKQYPSLELDDIKAILPPTAKPEVSKPFLFIPLLNLKCSRKKINFKSPVK